MTRTVEDLRAAIRESAGRFQRVESVPFTKEDLAAVCEAVGHDVDAGGRLPPKAQMRAAILRAVGEPAGDTDRPFRKAELLAIAATLEGERSS